ncbi:PR domain zinc finger protein [Echinococcus granulosus]|uniref:PR domain zinc finger protein n=1 Tax=Echinococcus granulosus TaxID=6210 RepID=W6UQC3_ECHGR|nr:PR domain zinc finger protein [Echinococcus granulosus]EUB55594.1 PR domain zinc finger protein [Echinococcus granulosus]
MGKVKKGFNFKALIILLLRRIGIVVRLAGRGLWQTGKILAFGRLTSHRASTSKPESVECAALQLNEGLVILRLVMDTCNGQYISSFPEFSFTDGSCFRQRSKAFDVDPHQCRICGKRFSQRTYLTRHKEIFHQSKFPLYFAACFVVKRAFACSHCNKSFLRRCRLNEHISVVHERRKSFTCQKCSKGFCRRGDLDKHISAVHEKRRPFTCQNCGKAFSCKGHLNRHVSTVHESGLSSLRAFCYRHNCTGQSIGASAVQSPMLRRFVELANDLEDEIPAGPCMSVAEKPNAMSLLPLLEVHDILRVSDGEARANTKTVSSSPVTALYAPIDTVWGTSYYHTYLSTVTGLSDAIS